MNFEEFSPYIITHPLSEPRRVVTLRCIWVSCSPVQRLQNSILVAADSGSVHNQEVFKGEFIHCGKVRFVMTNYSYLKLKSIVHWGFPIFITVICHLFRYKFIKNSSKSSKIIKIALNISYQKKVKFC